MREHEASTSMPDMVWLATLSAGSGGWFLSL